MALKRRSTAELRLDMDVSGRLPRADEQAALLRAQEKNARLVERVVKELADTFVGSRGFSNPDRTDRNRDYPGDMRDYYRAEVFPNGDVVLDNPTARADYFEFGTEPHEIWASGVFEAGQRSPARGSRGTFTRGARALAFNHAGGRFVGPVVDHPGQEPMPIMEAAMDQTLDQMAENVLDELEAELLG